MSSALNNPKYVYGGMKKPRTQHNSDERGTNIIRVKNLDTRFGGTDKYQSQFNYAMKCFGAFEYQDLKVLARG